MNNENNLLCDNTIKKCKNYAIIYYKYFVWDEDVKYRKVCYMCCDNHSISQFSTFYKIVSKEEYISYTEALILK